MTINNQRYMHNKPAQLKTLEHHTFSFSNVRVIHTNFCSVESSLFEISSDILAFCDSNINPSIPNSNFFIPGYVLLIRTPMSTCSAWMIMSANISRLLGNSILNLQTILICVSISLSLIQSDIFFLLSTNHFPLMTAAC